MSAALAKVRRHQGPGSLEGGQAPQYTCLRETPKGTSSANLEQQTWWATLFLPGPRRLTWEAIYLEGLCQTELLTLGLLTSVSLLCSDSLLMSLSLSPMSTGPGQTRPPLRLFWPAKLMVSSPVPPLAAFIPFHLRMIWE